MKKNYTNAELKIVRIKADIIATSETAATISDETSNIQLVGGRRGFEGDFEE